MSTTSHVQRIGSRRSTVVAAIIAASISVTAAVPATIAGHGPSSPGPGISMPAGGCGAPGC